MVLQLIVNADDYGRSASVSRGIRESHLRGVVTSTTCMMNFPGVMDDLARALQETPDLGLGVHLVLTAGRPLLPADQLPTLTAPNGAFLKLDKLIAGLNDVNPAAAKAEWRAQIEKFVRVTGRKPTHLDSHHHAAYFTAGLFRAMLELAQEYDCAVRQASASGKGTDMAGLPPEVIANVHEYAPRLLADFNPPRTTAFYASFYDELATQEELLRILHSLPEGGTYELMCHPGYADAALTASSAYARQRERELAVLTADATRQAVAARGITLVNYASLSRH